MIEHSYLLIAFPASNTPTVSVTGKISLHKNILELHYSLVGDIEDIILPSPSENSGRKDELWKSTCFEFFLAVHGQPTYWEFNMSPAGDWNVYRMDRYRRIGFREEASVQRFPFVVEQKENEFTLDAVVDLNPILEPNQVLEFGITAVLQTTDGNETFWALSHPAAVADFHLRESFILGLAEPIQLSS
jgi:hypothetical protein